MARSVSYEVYYLQRGRWQIHARYEERKRDDAIDEAKRLDSGTFEAACVIKETFDSDSNTSKEAVVYHTPTMKAKPPVDVITAGSETPQQPKTPQSKKPAPPPGSAAANAAADARKRVAAAKAERESKLAREKARRPAHPPSPQPSGGNGEPEFVDLLIRIAIAFLVACAVGTALGAIAIYCLQGLASIGIGLEKMMSQLLVIGSWVFGWAITFFPMFKRAVRNARRNSGSTGRRGQQARRRVAGGGKADAAAANAALAQEVAAIVGDSKAADDSGTDEEESSSLADLARDLADTLDDVEIDDEETSGPSDEDEDEPENEEESEIGEEAPEETEEEVEEETGEQPNREAAEAEEPDEEFQEEETGVGAVKTALSRLVQEAQELFGKLLHQDSYLRFGLILFIAGAAETFARRAGVAQKQLVDLLSMEIKELGASEAHARGFAANIDEYLLDQRYFDMYAAGRASALRISKGTNEETGLRKAVTKWRKPVDADQSAQGGMPDSKHYDGPPKKKGEGDDTPHGFVAVLFTDIVNSTNLQQTRGDQWMMNVVRAHNDVVRQALEKYRGQEIKHTGDGIMASFPDVVDGTRAALAMQEGFARFGKMMPDLAFEVRIGLSAGEPIHESGDIFGTPVNLAARVMSKASSGEVAVSANVREKCRSQDMKFQELGRFSLKGFQEPQPIYRVVSRRSKRSGGGKAAEVTVAGQR